MEYTIKPPKQKKRSKAACAAARSGCQLSHCQQDSGHCTRLDCQQLVAQKTQSLELRKIALDLSLDSRIEESQRLYTEIQEECDLTEFENGSMRSSLLAYHVGMKEMEQSISCKCPGCTLRQSHMVYKHDANKFAVVRDWVDALREYRSKYDFEAMLIQESKSTSYFTEGNYFQRIGTYRGHGASAIKPRLQMQNSYNVDALITNDMESRPLKEAP